MRITSRAINEAGNWEGIENEGETSTELELSAHRDKHILLIERVNLSQEWMFEDVGMILQLDVTRNNIFKLLL